MYCCCVVAQGFADRNSSAVMNFCRNPGYPESCYRERPWCYYGSGYGQWEYCYVPLCGEQELSLLSVQGVICSLHTTAHHLTNILWVAWINCMVALSCLVSPGKLSISCASLTAGRVATVVRQVSDISQASKAISRNAGRPSPGVSLPP